MEDSAEMEAVEGEEESTGAEPVTLRGDQVDIELLPAPVSQSVSHHQPVV